MDCTVFELMVFLSVRVISLFFSLALFLKGITLEAQQCEDLFAQKDFATSERFYYEETDFGVVEQQIDSETWARHATFAKGRSITPESEKQIHQKFYKRHGIPLQRSLAPRAVSEFDRVLWSLAVNSKREHLYFQVFSLEGELLETSGMTVGHYQEMPQATVALSRFLAAIADRYKEKKVILTATHTHPYEMASALSRKFSGGDVQTGNQFIELALEAGLSLIAFEMQLLHGDDPEGGYLIFKKKPREFAKVGYSTLLTPH